MKILHTADWHLGLPRSPYKGDTNIRLQDILNCLEEMLRIAREEKSDYALVCGDIFDTAEIRQARGHKEVLLARRIIMELAEVSGQVIVMRGTPNHDSMEAFEELRAHFAHVANVYIVTEPQVLQFEDADIAVLPGFDRGIYRAKFPGLSKDDENNVFTQELANIILGMKTQCRSDKTNILMAHYTVPGCNMESGQTTLLTQFEPVILPETLKAAGYDIVTLGHIHRPQQILSEEWFYCGAINAMNFSDEGQKRGFWIHNMLPFAGGLEHNFYETPIREFITFHFTDTDITAINLGNIDEVAMNYWRSNSAVRDKIVRIYYSCTNENSKALNKALIERTLLEDGAFMVWEILLDASVELANRMELASVTDPEENLKKYLVEKQVPADKIQELVARARPIIKAAEAGMTSAAETGLFVPEEISVKNYRNYEDETFNFADITFCTINGLNGAGKSSLFMDAIIDCLFEEPREGVISDSTGKSPWLRNADNVRSGYIMFSFHIGEKKYRVTRTRARSGKVTLNIAAMINGEWVDCSKEKVNDTQKEIIDIIGMNSFTFRSCALIMQDQYGIFLQAKPEERVEVLGTLLGLGIYQLMEKIALDKAGVNGQKNRELKKEIEIHNNTISDLGKPDETLNICKAELAEYEDGLNRKIAERDEKKLLLIKRQEAAERREKLLAEMAILQTKIDLAEQNRVNQQTVVDRSLIILNDRREIEEKSAEFRSLNERAVELMGNSALYVVKRNEAENLIKQAAEERINIDNLNERIKQKENELSILQPIEQDAFVREKVAEYERQKKYLEVAYEQERTYRVVEQELIQAKHNLQQITLEYEADKKRLQLKENGLEKKAELLSEVQCVDIENAQCAFLADAISAKDELQNYSFYYAKLEEGYVQKRTPIQIMIVELEKKLEEMEFSLGIVAEISQRVNELESYVKQLDDISQREHKIDLIKADLEHIQSSILETEKRLAMVKLKITETEKERDVYAEAFAEHLEVTNKMAVLKPWLEKEKQIPVEAEKNKTALVRIQELVTEIESIKAEIIHKKIEADKEILMMDGMDNLTKAITEMNAEADSMKAIIRDKQMKIGALQQSAVQINILKEKIFLLQEKKLEFAKEAADYEILKAAFGRSGIPHQIIRSIIPKLTGVSNNILGQMTGGRMGVEFRLENFQKNGKEKVTLDIFIEEYGKNTLPYLSKSGGEKVKSSLAVILSLAELKSSSAGIQMGMLFIDEPPFLDADGVDAYCDALETIQDRYRNMKIMAITHDLSMKARFPQNIDVVKTDHGSKVIY